MYLIIIFIVVVSLSLLLYMVKEAFANRIVQHEFTFSELPRSFTNVTFFFISDVHRRVISDKIIEKITTKADYVLIGGDLVENKVPINRIEKNLRKLTSVAPVFFVWGNNDYEVDEKILVSLFEKYGVVSLDNFAKVETNEKTNESIAIVGIKDRQFDSLQLWENDNRLATALNDIEDIQFRILISHKPYVIKRVLPEHKISLILCGHTHGGQIHIFGYSPYEKGGIRKFANTVALVSNGYGTTALPLRLGAKSETHLITLRKS